MGLRSFGVAPDERGVPRLMLNGAPYLHVGVLDQGYWPDGLLTAPSDAALEHDVATMKRLGFTMLRKHLKVEPLRWYHHCDRLGMLVWQDFVNGGGRCRTAAVTWPGRFPIRLDDTRRRSVLGRADAAGRALFREEMRRTVEHLRDVVSVAVWVPFNEGWGQFDAAAVAAEVTALDPTRVVDHASGWHDQGGGDLRSVHVYGRRFRVPRAPRPPGPGALRVRRAQPARRGARVRRRGRLRLREGEHAAGPGRGVRAAARRAGATGARAGGSAVRRTPSSPTWRTSSTAC